jgi:hypothetical protein
LDRLAYAILGSLARANRPVQCDAEIRTWLDQLSIPRADRRSSGLTRVCHPNFNGDTQVLARSIPANGVRRRLAWPAASARRSPYVFNAALLGVLVGSMASSMITADSKPVVRLVRPFGDGVIMKNTAQAFAGIGGLIDAVFDGFMAARKYDFSGGQSISQLFATPA